jgi:hypothetical protein
MSDFVSVMAEYLSNDTVLASLAHLDVLDPSPYQWQLPEEIRELARRLGRDPSYRSAERLSAYKRALQNRPAENIEKLLKNALTFENTRTAEATPVRFSYGIHRVFQAIGWEVNLPPLTSFLERQLKRSDLTEHSFVSFNYDLVLDYALWRLIPGAPKLRAFYGIEETMPAAQNSGLAVRLIKPHGSLNFIVNVKVPYKHTPLGLAHEEGDPSIPLTGTGDISYWTESDAWKEPCIVPPSPAKGSALAFLDRLRLAQRQALTRANEVFVLGWSIPETDREQADLIRECVAKPRVQIQRVTVVNYGQPPEYFFRVAGLFGVDPRSLRIYNAGFCRFVEEEDIDLATK